MKIEKNILIAFILNLLFSVFEFFGGLFTNSVAILSDSIHDFGDAISIGISYILEKMSKKKPDKNHTYGYLRYSVLGSIVTTCILLAGSILVIYNSIIRILNPVEINYSGMILLAIIGFTLNLIATFITKKGESLNQKAVNLHMLEDVLGWLAVLIGAIIMNFTNIKIIDPILSILVSIFILINSIKNLNIVLNIFLEKTPNNIEIDELKKQLLEIEEIIDIHHIHVWSIDGYNSYATMHIVSKTNNIKKMKEKIKDKLKEYNICHAILETEDEICDQTECNIKFEHKSTHQH